MDWSWLPWRVRDDVAQLRAQMRAELAEVVSRLERAQEEHLQALGESVTARLLYHRERIDTFDTRVSQLTDLTELTLSAVRARDAYKEAFDTATKTVGAMDAILAQHYAQAGRAGAVDWRHVLLNAEGQVVSERKARDGNAPTRIERGHGREHEWYRLTRIDGRALIYTPEAP